MRQNPAIGHRSRKHVVDVAVLQIDSLVIGNGCASNGATGFMRALAATFPTFICENEDRHRTPEVRAAIDAIAARLDRLSRNCRKQSLSLLVPMGDELFYRYHEALTFDLRDALRHYLQRLHS